MDFLEALFPFIFFNFFLTVQGKNLPVQFLLRFYEKTFFNPTYLALSLLYQLNIIKR